jgi:hypothetical protein
MSFGHFFLQLGLDDLPEQVEPAMLENDDFLQKFHHALLEVTIFICSRCVCVCEREREHSSLGAFGWVFFVISF